MHGFMCNLDIIWVSFEKDIIIARVRKTNAIISRSLKNSWVHGYIQSLRKTMLLLFNNIHKRVQGNQIWTRPSSSLFLEKAYLIRQDLRTPSQNIGFLLLLILLALSSIEVASKCGNISAPINAAMFVLKNNFIIIFPPKCWSIIIGLPCDYGKLQ